jgi:hypothetical protein
VAGKTAKESIFVSGADLVAALERVCAIMKEEVRKMPDMTYQVAAGGLKVPPSIAVVMKFDPETMRHETTMICSEKRAAKAWMKSNGIKI